MVGKSSVTTGLLCVIGPRPPPCTLRTCNPVCLSECCDSFLTEQIFWEGHTSSTVEKDAQSIKMKARFAFSSGGSGLFSHTHTLSRHIIKHGERKAKSPVHARALHHHHRIQEQVSALSFQPSFAPLCFTCTPTSSFVWCSPPVTHNCNAAAHALRAPQSGFPAPPLVANNSSSRPLLPSTRLHPLFAA